jgi:DNA-binding CsgD family transcriptional regulator
MTLSCFVAEDLPPLLDLLYGAAVETDQWPFFLQALMKPFDGANGVLHFFDIPTKTTPVAHTFGLETEYLLSYQRYFSNINPYPIQSFAKLPAFEVRRATDVLSFEEARQTEFYNDWMNPQGISPDHLGCMVHNDGREMVVLAIAPSAQRLERCGEKYIKQFEILMPHLRRAVALSKAARPIAAHGAVPAQFACGAMLISHTRAIKAVNPPAEGMLKEGGVLAVDPLGKLFVRDADSQTTLVRAVDAVFSRREPIGGPVECRLPQSDSRLSIVVLKLPAADAQVALVLLIAKAASGSLTSAAFTVAEMRLAKALLNGQSLAAFSEEAGISVNTARKQLASLFAKTGTNRQAALVAWLMQRAF